MSTRSFFLFLPEPESDHPHAFPPTDSGGLDPHSEEYFNKLVQALELDSPTYSHVDPRIMQEFKELLRKYPEAFYLLGSKLGTMKGFYHNIDTGQAPLNPATLHGGLPAFRSANLRKRAFPSHRGLLSTTVV